MVFAAGGTLVIDVAPPARRAEAVGYFGIAMLTTNAIGPALAESIAAGFGWAAVFSLCSAYCVVALVAALMLRAPSFEPSSGAFSIPRSWPLAGAYLASMAVGIGVGASKTFIPASLTQAGEPIGLYFVAYTLGAMLQRLGLGWLPDRLGRARATVLSLMVYAVAMLVVSTLQANWMLLLAPVIGMAHGMAYPASAALSVDLCAPQERGRVTAFCAGFFNLGFAVSASGLAPLEPWVGYRGLIAVGGVMLMACAFGVARLVGERRVAAAGS
jgi:predicted MFS family arabinose efflux permease